MPRNHILKIVPQYSWQRKIVIMQRNYQILLVNPLQ